MYLQLPTGIASSLNYLRPCRDFNFAECYSDRLFTRLAIARERREFTYRQLRRKMGEITVWDVLETLRSHYEEPYHPARGFMRNICMHYSGFLRPPDSIFNDRGN